MKKHTSTIILVLIFVIGLSLLLYPTVSDYWNSFHQSRAIATYTEQVAVLDNDTYAQIWSDAEAYNQHLSDLAGRLTLTDEEYAAYEACLNVSGNGIMGYIEIPSVGVYLPIYHGIGESVLQIAVGHIAGTSLPVGGVGTHCALSGHRGLPSAKLFTDLDQVAQGDTFLLHILDEILTYEVDQILIVEPDEVSDIQVVEGEDYCTLVTCTPYGINTHRLLVRGHRVENAEQVHTVRVTADAVQIEPLVIAPIVAVPLLLIALLMMLISDKKKVKRGGRTRHDQEI